MTSRLGLFALSALLVFGLQTACAPTPLLFSRPAPEAAVPTGTYRVIFYGGQNFHDLKTVVIVERADSPYQITPYGAAFTYRIVPDLTAAEARQQGEEFLALLHSFRLVEQRQILAPDQQTVIGYELRPLFDPLAIARQGDVVETSYVLGPGNRVTVYVGIKGEFQTDPDVRDRGLSANGRQ